MLRPGEVSTQETYYDVLCVTENASHDEIRARYKAALLNSHPDKLNTRLDSNRHQQVHERFLKIQRAWEVLGNAESRAGYDREMKIKSPEFGFTDEVELNQMSLKGSGDAVELVYPCRCGDNFSISAEELEETGVLVDGNARFEILDANVAPVSVTIPCSSCSLRICLTIDVSY